MNAGFSELLRGRQVSVLSSTLLARWPWAGVDDGRKVGQFRTWHTLSGGPPSPRRPPEVLADAGGCLLAFE